MSIVIPTLGGDLILRCLDSLRRNISTAVAHEVVIVANGPSAARLTASADFSAPAIRLVASAANLGFGGGCNRGAAESSGEFLLFLNDDIEVLPGWLEALVETADRHPDAGAVGSLILFPDSTMQEAGAIVWRDGSTLCINRGGQVEVNPYNFLRPVDYCSACSLLVRRQPWAALGGFDARYFPAYYEGVDLCFGLARAGFRILFQPRSRAVHRETASSSTLRRDFAPQSLRKLRQRLIDHAYLGVRPLELRGTDVFIEKNKTSRFQAVAHLRVQVLQGGNVVNSRQPENDVVRWRSNTTWFRSAAR